MGEPLSDAEHRRLKNARDRDRKKRRKLRDRLEREGYSAVFIEEIIVRQRDADLVARRGEQDARDSRRHHAAKNPSDKGYKPVLGDPLLRGAGRADGMTAKVIRQGGDSITDWQYESRLEHKASPSMAKGNR